MDETNCKPIVEFVGLKPKIYSITISDAVIGDAQPRITTKEVGKGIAWPTLKLIPHENYLTIYRKGKQEILSNKRIGSKLHQVNQAVNYLQFNDRTLINYLYLILLIMLTR